MSTPRSVKTPIPYPESCIASSSRISSSARITSEARRTLCLGSGREIDLDLSADADPESVVRDIDEADQAENHVILVVVFIDASLGLFIGQVIRLHSPPLRVPAPVA